MPFFSIIIPVYNVAPYLRECLDSVLAQTFTDWEAICVDDGSTDGSGAILDEYAARDSRFRVIHQPNAGVSAARNNGMFLAKGWYITFCDADDMYYPQWLKVAYSVIARTNVDLLRMSYVSGKRYDAPCSVEEPDLDEVDVVTDKNDIVAWGWLELLKGGFSVLLFIRRELINDTRIFPEGMRVKEDNIFCLKIIQRVKNICQVDYRGYYYRDRESSAVHQSLPFRDSTRFFDELIARFMYVQKHFDSNISEFALRQTNRYLMDDLAGYVMTHKIISHDERVAMFLAISHARSNGCLRVFDVPKAWCIPLIFMVTFKSTLGFTLNKYLVDAYAKIRSMFGCKRC